MNSPEKDQSVFINFSNHPSEKWEEAQTLAALQLADQIVDVSFPQVNPHADEEELAASADEQAAKILALHPAVAMCQGEFGMCYCVIRRLQAAGLPVYYACSERNVQVEGNIKTVRFVFTRFRMYENE